MPARRRRCSSICTEVLNLSEHEAYLRIGVARAARSTRYFSRCSSDGRLHLSGIARLLPLLTEDQPRDTSGAGGASIETEIEELVAELSPKPDVPATIRKLPAGERNTDPSRSSSVRTESDRSSEI